ncbi:MAG: hypothetical protein HY326_10695 [Chloroflexi bacterium]|nr:hypothetical protein [Chloroflexota bacterium]
MNTIMIEKLDETTATWLEAEARRRGISVEQMVVALLQEAVDKQRTAQQFPPYHDVDALAGTWTEEEAQIFAAAIADFEEVDQDLWK